ncbi:hypothetical protein [Henriciella sp.]|uniref:CC0125/CC1285 family lipoprotein n=1 Tax=Henriciella sp. TaxID=1968823 RepID=UPI00260C76C5|nr:hypothetical protein [Henriciella sp.]
MIQLKSIGLAGGLLLMGACASVPDYRPATNARATGYSETQIETNRYTVSYRLNDDDSARAQSLALRRAAELTLESGYDTFELVSKASDKETEREQTFDSSGPDYAVQRDCGLLGCSSRVAPIRDPFASDIERERNSVTVTLEIFMSDKDASVSPSLYDASEVFANLSS